MHIGIQIGSGTICSGKVIMQSQRLARNQVNQYNGHATDLIIIEQLKIRQLYTLQTHYKIVELVMFLGVNHDYANS